MLPESSNQPSSDPGSSNMQENPVGDDDITSLITDAFRYGIQNFVGSSGTHETTRMCESSTFIEQTYIDKQIQPSTSESTRYHNLMKEADEQLYPGCLKFSKIFFFIYLFYIKYMNGWSGKSFTMLLRLLNDAFPEGNGLPFSYYEAKKVVNNLDLGYQKIHSYPKDCILYHGKARHFKASGKLPMLFRCFSKASEKKVSPLFILQCFSKHRKYF